MSLIKRPKSSQFDLIQVDECKRILSQYDLGTLVRIGSLIVADNNIVNLLERSETSRKFSVYTTKGIFFLKQVPWYCNEIEKIQFSTSYSNFLNMKGLPVPYIFSTKRGANYADTDFGRYTIAELKTGAMFCGDSSEIRSSAEQLALMHKVSEGEVSDFVGERNSPTKVLDEHLNLASKIASERQEDGRIFDSLKQSSHFTSLCLKEYCVHGDFIPWNLAYSGGKVCAVYDFDNACIDSRLHDLGEAIVAWSALDFANRSAQLRPKALARINSASAYCFYEAYESVYPLRDEEKDNLGIYIISAWWEALLLGYIKGEIPITEMCKLPHLIDVAMEWSKNVK